MKTLLGRRGAFLLTLGIVWILYGYAILSTDSPARLGDILWIPLWVWGWIWVAGGTLGVIHAWLRKPGRDWPGFVGIMAPVIGWASGYTYTWAVYDAPKSWISAAVWAAVSAMTAVVAGWPEPPDTHGGKRGRQ